MNKMVMLDYTFLFEPDNTWGHLYQFESELSKFFASRGFEAQIVKSIEGQQGRRILLIKRVDPLHQPGNPPEKSVGPQQQLTSMQQVFPPKKQNKPKFIPTKGYLKR